MFYIIIIVLIDFSNSISSRQTFQVLTFWQDMVVSECYQTLTTISKWHYKDCSPGSTPFIGMPLTLPIYPLLANE